MRRLERDGIVLSSTLDFDEGLEFANLAIVQIEGRIVCSNGAAVDVTKRLQIRRGRQNRLEVRGIDYGYHALHQTSGRSLFRYCTAHGLDDLHVHRFDADGNETSQPRIPLDQLPTLADAILEAVDLAPVLKP